MKLKWEPKYTHNVLDSGRQALVYIIKKFKAMLRSINVKVQEHITKNEQIW